MKRYVLKKVQHGSLGFNILSYARFKTRTGDGCFSANDYKNFHCKLLKSCNIYRALEALVRNGHLQQTKENRYRYIETHVLYDLHAIQTQSLHLGNWKK